MTQKTLKMTGEALMAMGSIFALLNCYDLIDKQNAYLCGILALMGLLVMLTSNLYKKRTVAQKAQQNKTQVDYTKQKEISQQLKKERRQGHVYM